MVHRQVALAVQTRIGFEGESKVFPRDRGIDTEEQVFGGSGCQDVKLTDDVTEPNRLVKHHDVHGRTRRLAGSALLSLETHVLVAKSLMPQRAGHLHRDLPNQLLRRHVPFQLRTDGHDVGQHSA